MAKARKPKSEEQKPESSGAVVRHQKLCLSVDTENKRLYGYTELKISPPESGMVGLHADNMTIESILVDGEPAAFEFFPHYQHVEDEKRWESVNCTAAAADAASTSYLASLDKEMAPNLLILCSKKVSLSTENQSRDAAEERTQPSLGDKNVKLVHIDYWVEKAETGIHFRDNVVHTDNQIRRAHCWFPCMDSSSQRCCYDLEFTVDHKLVAVSNGDLLYQVLSKDDPPRKTYVYSLSVPVTAECISLAVGPFEIFPDRQNAMITHLCLTSNLSRLRHTVGFFFNAYSYFEEYLSASFPFGSYKQVFLMPEMTISSVSLGASMCIFSSQVLFDEKVIDQSVLSFLSLLKRIDRLLQFDRLMPIYNGILTLNCIRTLTQIALKLSVAVPLGRVVELIRPFQNVALWQIRIEASRALLDLEFHGKGLDDALILFMQFIDKEPSLRGQVKLARHVLRMCQSICAFGSCDTVKSTTLIGLLRHLGCLKAFNNVFLRHQLFCILHTLAGRPPTLYGVPRIAVHPMPDPESCSEPQIRPSMLKLKISKPQEPPPPELTVISSEACLSAETTKEAEAVSNGTERRLPVVKIRVKQNSIIPRVDTELLMENSRGRPIEVDLAGSSSASVDAPVRIMSEPVSISNQNVEEVNSSHDHGSRMTASVGSAKFVKEEDIGKELQCTAYSKGVALVDSHWWTRRGSHWRTGHHLAPRMMMLKEKRRGVEPFMQILFRSTIPVEVQTCTIAWR